MLNHQHTLSVSMIVRNEERHLGRLLQAVRDFADEIVITDTGSTDRTVEIALAHGATVRHFAWCDDFAAARNASLQTCSCDFVMWLDADDVVEPATAEGLNALFCGPIDWDLLYLPYYYSSTPEAKHAGKRKLPLRIWRNRLGVHWIYPIHEFLMYPKSLRRKVITTGIEILHQPLRSATGSSDRNLRIMKGALRKREYRHDDYINWHIAKEHSQIGNPRQAIRSLEKAIAYCPPGERIRMARLQFALARQYRRLGDHHRALAAAGRSAAAVPMWREPYCEMARSYARLGGVELAMAHLDLARQIPMPDHQVEQAELYDLDGIEQLRARLEATKAPPMSPPIGIGAITIAAGGDVCLGRQLPGYVDRHGPDWCLGPVRKRLRQADVALVNLECAVTTLGDFVDKGGRQPYYYRAHPDMLNLLIRAGVDIVTLSNNHALDFGGDAMEQMIEALYACGIGSVGGGRDYLEATEPAFLRVKGVTIGVVAFETQTPSFGAEGHRPGIAHADERLAPMHAAGMMARARECADFVIASPHWGANWTQAPTERRRALARQLIDLGADAVIGHSAHVLHGVEVHAGRPIVYDMGTLLFDRVATHRMRFSALFELDFGQGGAVRLSVTPVRLRSGKARFADEEDGGFIRDLVTWMSSELDRTTVFRQSGDALVLDLSPTPRGVRPGGAPMPQRLYGLGSPSTVPEYYANLKSNAVRAAVPTEAALPAPIAVSDWLTIEAVRIAGPVRPGYGFVCEVHIRVDRPPEGQWEVVLTGTQTDGSGEFSYIHPIAEGAWPPSRWSPHELICDRVVVRPAGDPGPGHYLLRYGLIDRSRPDLAAVTNGVEIGSIILDPRAPERVCGIVGEGDAEVG